eukprot:2875212-Rhodomonas_salina.2
MRPFADAKLPQVTPAPFLLPCCPLGSAAMFSAMRCASVYGSRKICLVYGDTRRAADVNGGKAAENGDAADVRWGGGAGTDGRGAASSSQLLHPARRVPLRTPSAVPSVSVRCLLRTRPCADLEGRVWSGAGGGGGEGAGRAGVAGGAGGARVAGAREEAPLGAPSVAARPRPRHDHRPGPHLGSEKAAPGHAGHAGHALAAP